jgi:hypothetical protein
MAVACWRTARLVAVAVDVAGLVGIAVAVRAALTTGARIVAGAGDDAQPGAHLDAELFARRAMRSRKVTNPAASSTALATELRDLAGSSLSSLAVARFAAFRASFIESHFRRFEANREKLREELSALSVIDTLTTE